jgi:DNA-binding transcriptional LysR family regulator
MDRLDAMRAFAAVADLGSFAEAARRLRLSPAAVTRAVALLEDRLGQMLLNRTTRSVRLTERGAVYLETCKRILLDVEEADRRVRGEDAAPRGTLTIAAPVMFGRLHVLPIVGQMLRKHRNLAVRLTLSDRMVHLVEEEIDAAVRIGDLADSAMLGLTVGEVRRVLVASPDYLAVRGAPATPAALAGHDLIAFESIDATNDWRFAQSSVRIEPLLAVNTADAAIAAAEAGLGITRTLSYQVHAALEAGRLRVLLDDFAPPPIPVTIVYPRRRQGSANVAAFVLAARQHLRALPVIAGTAPPEDDTRGAPAHSRAVQIEGE